MTDPTPGPIFTGDTGSSTAAAALTGIKISDVPWQGTPWGTIPATGKQAFRFSNFTSDRIGFAFQQPPSNATWADEDFAWVLPRVFINGAEVFPFPADPWGADVFPDGQTSGDPGVYESGIGSLFLMHAGVYEYTTPAGPTPGPIFTGDTGSSGTGGTPGPLFTGDTSGTTTPGATIGPTEVIIFADSLPRVSGWSFCYGIPELDSPVKPGLDNVGVTLSPPVHWSNSFDILTSPEEWSISSWYETADFYGVWLPPGFLYAWPFADPLGKDFNNPADYDVYDPRDSGTLYSLYFLPDAYTQSGYLKVYSNPGASGFEQPWSYVGYEPYYSWSKGDAMRLWTGRGTINGGYVQDVPGPSNPTLPYTAGILKVWDGGRWSFVTTFGSPNTPPGADWPSNIGPQPGPLFTGDDTGSGGGTPGPLFTG